jgi:TolB-like protein
MKYKKYRRLFFITLLFSFLIISTTPSLAEPTRIAIFPFQIHSAENLDYLQAGLYGMLTNRFESSDGSIEVIPREELAQKIMAAPATTFSDKSHISQTLQADYFVSGSLTAFGASISTDVQFYRINQTAPLVKLSQTGSQDDVIAHIDEFAAMVNQKVFDKVTESSVSATEETGVKPDQTIKGLSVVVPKRSQPGRWQSQAFKTHFKGVSVGDVDGDGANEIVAIDKNRVNVYRYENDNLLKITHVEHRRNSLFLSVDLADVNRNNKAEIFISSHGKISERPESFIYEHQDGSLLQIANRTRWYYRVLNDHKGLPMLIAQKKLIKQPFAEKIHIMGLENGKYTGVDTVTPPYANTIYDMAFTKNAQTDKRLFVGYDRRGEITARSDDGQILWESGEPFGGSLNYIEYTNRQDQETVRTYIAKRILLADTDGNGQQEMIAIRNVNSSPAWMTKFRRYKQGYIACLEWDASGTLQSKWKTDSERGYISDIALADVTHDGKVDLVFTVVSDVKRKQEKSSSYLVIQQLP